MIVQKSADSVKYYGKLSNFALKTMLLWISRILEKGTNRFKSSSVPTADVDFKSAQTQTK